MQFDLIDFDVRFEGTIKTNDGFPHDVFMTAFRMIVGLWTRFREMKKQIWINQKIDANGYNKTSNSTRPFKNFNFEFLVQLYKTNDVSVFILIFSYVKQQLWLLCCKFNSNEFKSSVDQFVRNISNIFVPAQKFFIFFRMSMNSGQNFTQTISITVR